MCEKLNDALKLTKALFDCVGGCGIDTSFGKEQCMSAYGSWFNYCPFCGRKIIKGQKEETWIWYEENLQSLEVI